MCTCVASVVRHTANLWHNRIYQSSAAISTLSSRRSSSAPICCAMPLRLQTHPHLIGKFWTVKPEGTQWVRTASFFCLLAMWSSIIPSIHSLTHFPSFIQLIISHHPSIHPSSRPRPEVPLNIMCNECMFDLLLLSLSSCPSAGGGAWTCSGFLPFKKMFLETWTSSTWQSCRRATVVSDGPGFLVSSTMLGAWREGGDWRPTQKPRWAWCENEDRSYFHCRYQPSQLCTSASNLAPKLHSSVISHIHIDFLLHYLLITVRHPLNLYNNNIIFWL